MPGIRSTIETLSGFYIQGALNHLLSTMQENPTQSAASMLWIGYDAPNDAHEWRAAGHKLAREGGDILYSDVRAFNAARNTWTGEGSKFTGNHIFGHSYGSTTTSYAGRDGRLKGYVSTVTLIGSPGPDHSATQVNSISAMETSSSRRRRTTSSQRWVDELPIRTVGCSVAVWVSTR